MQARNSSRLVSEGKRASGPVGGEGYDGGREDDATMDEVETTNSSLYTRTHAHTCPFVCDHVLVRGAQSNL